MDFAEGGMCNHVLATQLLGSIISNLNIISALFDPSGQFCLSTLESSNVLYCISLLFCLQNSKNRLVILLLVRSAQNGYTFHPQIIPPYIFFKMCNPFYIGLKLPNVNEALWNRMAQALRSDHK